MIPGKFIARRALCHALFVVGLAGLVRAQDQHWRNGEVLTFARSLPAGAEALVADGARHVIARFDRGLSAHARERWSAYGIVPLQALDKDVYVVRVAPHPGRRVSAPPPGLVGFHEFRSDWKLHPELAAGTSSAAPNGGELRVVYILLHEDERLERGRELVGNVGGRVLDELVSLRGLVASVPTADIRRLVEFDSVLWVEPALPSLAGVTNDSSRVRAQADVLQAEPYGLDGSGIDVLVYDVGTARATHDDFGGRLAARDFSGAQDHSTHVAATVGGSGAASGGLYRGMAPGVTLESYGLEGLLGIPFMTNPGDLERDYAEAIQVFGADIASNSLGLNLHLSSYDCAVQGDYGVTSQLLDGIVRGSLGRPFPVVWANGNERANGRCEVEGFPGFYSTSPPATAKNPITVGAVNSNSDSMTSFSSWGPTDDGRLRPDVCGPGCQTNGDRGVTSASAAADRAYLTICGTSMATPAVCGVAALLMQDHRARSGGVDPLNSTLKAVLAHTAQDRGTPGPDYAFGYGSVRALAAIEVMRRGQSLEDQVVEPRDSRTWILEVADDADELRVTLAWDDAPSLPNVLEALVNDLDLEVRDPHGLQHHVWTHDPSNPSAPAERGRPDRVNNLEQVLVERPAEGTWAVTVRGHEVPAGPQSFSLVSSHPMGQGPSVSVSFPQGLPEGLVPGTSTRTLVRLHAVNDALIPGSPTMHVRYLGTAFIELPMEAVGGEVYQAEFPPPVCSARPEFFITVRGEASGTTSDPPAGADAPHAVPVDDTTLVFYDDFELDRGWKVAHDPSLTGGGWERALPADGARGGPAHDFDGSGRCFATGAAAGNTDVDGGPTILTSPALALASTPDPLISCALWFTNDDRDADRLVLELSNDDGLSWVLVEALAGGDWHWRERSYRVAEHLVPTDSVRMRFRVADEPNDSVCEAGLDAFRVVAHACVSLADCNRNGIGDSDDLASGRSLDADDDGRPDECSPRLRARQR